MKSRPIIFSKPMVIALLNKQKTVTRRIAKKDGDGSFKSPYGQAADLLWVKETWATEAEWDTLRPSELPVGTKVRYKATDDHPAKWRTPLFMPRWASRLLLQIEHIRLERLHEISLESAIGEGLVDEDPIKAYSALWEALHGSGSWEDNPWVWVIEFKLLDEDPVTSTHP